MLRSRAAGLRGRAAVSGARRQRMGQNAVTYLLRAQFHANDQAFSDDQVLDTAAEGVSVGQLTAIINDGALAIASNQLSVTAQTTPAWGDLGIVGAAAGGGAFTRAIGLAMIARSIPGFMGSNNWWHTGWRSDAAVTDANGQGMYLLYASGQCIPERKSGTPTKSLPIWHAQSDLDLAVILRSTGAWYLRRDEQMPYWRLVWMSYVGNTASVYPDLSYYGQYGVATDFKVRQMPEASIWVDDFGPATYQDAFMAANGTNLHGRTPSAKGSNTWVVQSGMAAIQTNAAQFSAAGIATIDTGDCDLFLDVTMKTPATWATAGGLIVRWTDANNYWYVKFSPPASDPDIELVEVNGGVATTRASANVGLTANTTYNIRVATNGYSWWKVYTAPNNWYLTERVTYETANPFNVAATVVGLRDEGDAQFTFDDLVVWPMGTAGEYESPAIDPDYTAEPGGFFSIVISPDLHVGGSSVIIQAICNWVAANARTLNIQAYTEVGDLVNNGSAAAFDKADEGITILDGANLPYLLAAGNHDHDLETFNVGRNLTEWNAQFPQARYTGKSWWAGGFYEAGHSENAYYQFSTGGHDYILMCLEPVPRQAVIDWAVGICNANADADVFLITHEYLYYDGTRYESGDNYDLAVIADSHDGEEMWTELVNVCPNIRLVWSGHDHPDGTGAVLQSTNSAGKLVTQVFAGQITNGATQVLKIYPALNQLEVTTLAMVVGFNTYYRTAAHLFTVQYE